MKLIDRKNGNAISETANPVGDSRPQAFGSRRINSKKKFRDYALTSKGRSVCAPRRTGGILRMASFMDKADGAISTLSFALTYSVLLSTIFDGFPLSREGNM